MSSPFEILQVESDATEAEIKQAYRERVKETHPDQGGSAAEFQAVKAAYEAIQSGEFDLPEDPREPSPDPSQATAPNRGKDETQPPESSRVEYLNYEVLDDYGWTLHDDDLFEKASDAGLDPSDYGRFLAKPNESLLEAAENRGFAWPYACRGGACANCAVALLEGELSMPVDHILPPEMMERDIRLSCNGTPVTDELKVVYNVKHLPGLEELRLPPRPFEQAHLDD